MGDIRASDGRIVTEETIGCWAETLAHGEWPAGWKNVGPVVRGRPPMSPEGSTVLSVKIPPAMKRAIEHEAADEGVSVSDFVRAVIASDLLRRAHSPQT